MNELNGDSDFSDNVSPTDPPFGADSIALSPGEFWVEYLNQADDTVTVKVTARVGDAVRVIEQTAGQGGSGYEYVTIAGGNLNMISSSGTISGDVGLTGSANIDPDVVVNGNIVEDPTLEVPTLDFPTYEAMCDSTHSGNMTFSSDYTGDLCVTGNVTFNAGVTYTGLLYAGGNVTINGDNVVINGTIVAEGNVNGDNQTGLQFNAQPLDPDVHMPAIATDGVLSLKNADNLQVNGVVWSDGSPDFTNTDNMVYTGSFITNGNVLMNNANNLTLTFDAALLAGIPGLTGGGVDTTGSLSLSGWKTY